jgi:cellulose biosynthesis protein BcsQ
VVIDVGFCLEEDEELSYDSMVPRRNATTISALATADHIVAVGSMDAIGLARLVHGLDDLKQVVGREPSVVVANRGMGRSRQVAVQRQVKEILRETGHDVPAMVLPFDREACSEALHAGRSLIRVAPQSALAKNLHLLARTLVSHLGGEQGIELGDRTALGRLRRLSA